MRTVNPDVLCTLDADHDREMEIQDDGKIKRVRVPNMPSQEEVDAHMVSHVPCRSWCPHCVAGQAQPRHHVKRDQGEDTGIPTVSLDYMFMSSGERGKIKIVKGKKVKGEKIWKRMRMTREECQSC